MRLTNRFSTRMTALMCSIFVTANAVIFGFVFLHSLDWVKRVADQELFEMTFSLRVLMENQLSSAGPVELRHSLTSLQGREDFSEAFLVNGQRVLVSATPRRQEWTRDTLLAELGIDNPQPTRNGLFVQGDHVFSKTSICLPLRSYSPSVAATEPCSELYVVMRTDNQLWRMVSIFQAPIIVAVIVFLGSVTSFWFLINRFLASRIRRFTEYFEKSARQPGLVQIHERRKDEFSFFSDVINHYIAQLNRATEALRSEAHFDPLTGTMRRPHFQDLYANNRRTTDYYLALLDIDEFKAINTSHGHLVGDIVLAGLAANLKSDMQSAEVICRFGGEEFLALVPVSAVEGSPAEYFGGIVKSVGRREIPCENTTVICTISLGYVLLRRNENITMASEKADIALRYAKATGKNRAVEADEELLDSLGYMANTPKMADIISAIRKHEISYHLQPIIDIASGRPVGYEALVRWQLHDGSFVPLRVFLNQFIAAIRDKSLSPHLERIIRGSIPPLDHLPGRDTYISFNYDPFDLFNKFESNSLTPVLQGLVADGYRIAIEVTETAYLGRMPVDVISRLLAKVQSYGFDVHLDDFGKEGSGLERLATFDFKTVKADRSLIVDLQVSPRKQYILRLLVELTNAIGAKLVVEGVETEADLEILRGIGVQRVQGYLYGRPRGIEQFEKKKPRHQAVEISHAAR